MPCPILTSSNLNRGVLNFLKHPKWRKDFHNLFYKNVTASLVNNRSLLASSIGAYFARGKYGPDLWSDMIGELQFWKALRPFPKTDFLNHTMLPRLQNAYANTFVANPPGAPTPALNPPQPQFQSLFNAAMVLKSGSIVFASKCCHMLLPCEFPISDGKFSGVSVGRSKMLKALDDWNDLDENIRATIVSTLNMKTTNNAPTNHYWAYRLFILTAWDTLPAAQQNQLIAILDAAIHKVGTGRTWSQYPYRTRIPELCLA